jgi:hypothetical protein
MYVEVNIAPTIERGKIFMEEILDLGDKNIVYNSTRCILHRTKLDELLAGQKEIKDILLGNGKPGIRMELDRLKNPFAVLKVIISTIGLLVLSGIGAYLYTVIFHTISQ